VQIESVEYRLMTLPVRHPDAGSDGPLLGYVQVAGRLDIADAQQANLLTTLVLFTFVGADQARVTKVQESWAIVEVVPGGGAEAGGLKVGDQLMSIGDLRFPGSDFETAVALIQAKVGQPVPFRVSREGQVLDLPLTPRLEGGKGRLGFRPASFATPLERRSFQPADVAVGGRFAAVSTWVLTTKVFGYLHQVVTFRAKSAEVAGPIGIIRQSSKAAKHGWTEFLWLCGAISLQLGLLNALPIPALDGGHMALLTFEKLRRRDLSIATKEKILTGGMLLLISLMGFVIVLDILKLRH